MKTCNNGDRDDNYEEHGKIPEMIELGSKLDGNPCVKVAIYGERADGYFAFPLLGWSLEVISDSLVVCKPKQGFFVTAYDCKVEYGVVAEVELSCSDDVVYLKYPVYLNYKTGVGWGEGIIFSAPLDIEVELWWKCKDWLFDRLYSGLIVFREGEVHYYDFEIEGRGSVAICKALE